MNLLSPSAPVLDRLPHAVAESASLPASARVMLLALAAILLVLLGAVVTLALALRRRPRAVEAGAAGDDPAAETSDAPGNGARALACPTCRREYDAGLRFCPRDARALVPAVEVADRGRSAGSICPRCRRAFEPGVRYCPYDAADLVPSSVFEATRAGADSGDDEPSGVLGRICPRCRRRYDLGASFCGRDGCELAVIN